MINVTKHPIRFQSAAGEVYEVASSGVVIDARFQEEVVGSHSSGVQLVRARILPTPAAEEQLAALELNHPGELIVGSLIAAQAFPGRVVALVAAEGFERVPSDQKRMRDDKFTTFLEGYDVHRRVRWDCVAYQGRVPGLRQRSSVTTPAGSCGRYSQVAVKSFRIKA